MALLVSGILFGLFVLNVLSGALMSQVYLSDVQEMLLLFVASIVFVAAILKREADSKGD